MFINYPNHIISKLSKKVPLKTVIIVPFVIQIFAVVGLTGWLSFRNGQKAVEDIATQSRSEITTHIQQYLESQIQMPHRANQMNKNAIQLGLLDLNDINLLKRHLWQQIQQFKTVNYIGIATEQSTYIGAGRLDSGSIRLDILEKTKNHSEIWDTNGRKIPQNDPRNQPWYIDAVNAKKPIWSQAYRSTRPTTLSINQPIYDNNDKDKLLAVATAKINVLEINQFLRSLKIGQMGQSFIMERSGRVIATSSYEKTDHNTGRKAFNSQTNQDSEMGKDLKLQFQNQAKPFDAIGEHDALIRTAAHYLSQSIGDLKTTQQKQTLDFRDHGEKYFLQMSPFKDKYQWGSDWLIVVIVPETDFMAGMDANMYYTILLCLAALLVTILVGILTAQWLIQPLLRLNTAAKALAKGEWQQMIEIERQDEVGELAKSFSRMGKQLQELFTTLKAKNTELQRLDQLKDEFLANTSHELRTPLHGIIGIAESLFDGATGQLSPHTRSELSMIVASGQRLSSLINDILDFSKQKHKKIELQLKPVALQQIADLVLKFSKPLVGKKNVQLINAIPPNLPLANADENRVQQILHNLIGNAIKFTDKGCIEISAEVRERWGASDSVPRKMEIPRSQLAITVSDTGIGIPADKTTQIFELLEQIKDYSVQRNGTGLGLAVTKQLVTLHGGEIWAKSTVDVGSQFTFTLPIFSEKDLVQGHNDQKSAMSLFEGSAPVGISRINTLAEYDGQRGETLADVSQSVDALADLKATESGLIRPENEQNAFKILIVDDEPVNLHVLTNHLSLYNYAILQASSGFEALAALEKGATPDLILLDVMMPHMTGYEVTEKIREHWKANELPIVLLTAKNQVADLVMGLEVGANDYLVKPISKNELLARIKTHLHIKQLKAETLRLVIESERRLTQFLEAVPVGVFVTDANGHPYYANQKAQQLLGKGVVSEITAKQFVSTYQIYLAGTTELYPNNRQPAVLALQGQSAAVDDMEIHPAGRLIPIPIEAWGTPIFDEKGHISYAMMAFADITERKQAEAERERFNQQLIQLNKELEEYSHTLEEKVEERTHKLQEAKKAAENALQQLQATQQQLIEAAKMADLGNLVAGVAHEINTPIGIGVTAASRLDTLTKELIQTYESQKMKRADLEKYLKSAQLGSDLILKNLTRAAELIQSFKQVAVDQTGEQQRTFGLKDYLHEILMTLRPEFKRTKHQVSIVCDPNITLSSYPGIFSQIFTNLIINSLIHGLKEQPEGQMTIVVTQTDGEKEKGARELMLRYSDNGKGIPANTIKKIFEPFFTTNRQGGGSGLGLHIVYNLVTHKLNGTIHCESVEGEGTTFIIKIPF